jgi:lysozyme
MKHPRTKIGALALSAAALVALVSHEGYTDFAMIPVAGDVPTVGFGSTKRDDGTPVRIGDKITPTHALARSLAHIQRDETKLRQCVTAPLLQAEYDLLVDHAYQYGAGATCSSTIVRLTNAGRYLEACEGYSRWRFVAGRDCAKPGSGCRGVALRAEERRIKCLEAQK